jgi:hypothetical protein
MSLHRHSAVLFALTEASAEAQTGSSYAVLPADGDGQADSAQGFRALISATQSGGATSPTTDVKVETSADGTNWVEVAGSTQLTADGSTYEFKALEALGPLVRARTALGGGTLPSHTAKVVLVSNGPFRLKKVA